MDVVQGNLNVAADRDNIKKITRFINGGDNGLPERRAFFNRLFPLPRDSLGRVARAKAPRVIP